VTEVGRSRRYHHYRQSSDLSSDGSTRTSVFRVGVTWVCTSGRLPRTAVANCFDSHSLSLLSYLQVECVRSVSSGSGTAPVGDTLDTAGGDLLKPPVDVGGGSTPDWVVEEAGEGYGAYSTVRPESLTCRQGKSAKPLRALNSPGGSRLVGGGL